MSIPWWIRLSFVYFAMKYAWMFAELPTPTTEAPPAAPIASPSEQSSSTSAEEGYQPPGDPDIPTRWRITP